MVNDNIIIVYVLGSRLVFGTVIHKNCVIVVDTSGSMGPSMEIMKKALVALIWEQISSQECM